MRSNYNILNIILSIYLERIHRRVFDKYYKQDHKIVLSERLFIEYYKILIKIFPEYRQYVKYWKEVICRGYAQSRLSLPNYAIYCTIRKINTDRYSNYFK